MEMLLELMSMTEYFIKKLLRANLAKEMLRFAWFQRKTQHSPHFLRLCVRFSLCGSRRARLSLACNSENERTAIAFGDYKTNCREFEDNPNEKGVPYQYAFLRSEFSTPRDDLGARILHNRAASPFLQKQMFLQIRVR